jgi:hypothetical protein
MMDQAKLKEVLAAHAAWLRGDEGGIRAYLQGADLQGADLRDANLQGAYLQGAYLQGAYLQRADLQGANLQRAYLQGANLQRAYLQGADLRDANLQGANLQGANLQDADLRDAKLPHFQIVPSEGAFIGWKKASGKVLKVEIPAEARRTSSLIGRKCRAEFVRVLEIEGDDGGAVAGDHDSSTVYITGEITRADSFDDDIRVECTNGIHFFLTREEAQEY